MTVKITVEETRSTVTGKNEMLWTVKALHPYNTPLVSAQFTAAAAASTAYIYVQIGKAMQDIAKLVQEDEKERYVVASK